MFPKPVKRKRGDVDEAEARERAWLKRWYGFLKEQPCIACGARRTFDTNIVAAHIEVVLSHKSDLIMPRSHKGRAAWGAVPLCEPCHLEQHDEGERAFFERRLHRPVEGVWGSLLLTFFTSESGVPF